MSLVLCTSSVDEYFSKTETMALKPPIRRSCVLVVPKIQWKVIYVWPYVEQDERSWLGCGKNAPPWAWINYILANRWPTDVWLMISQEPTVNCQQPSVNKYRKYTTTPPLIAIKTVQYLDPLFLLIITISINAGAKQTDEWVKVLPTDVWIQPSYNGWHYQSKAELLVGLW